MRSLEYEIVDVFTDRPYAGNPLAVVFGADDLAATQMQQLANEFHLSETVFVLPPTSADATYRARIFTPEAELPFAGHPSVGAAVTQMRAGLLEPGPAGAGVRRRPTADRRVGRRLGDAERRLTDGVRRTRTGAAARRDRSGQR
jgi:hypothetical protein